VVRGYRLTTSQDKKRLSRLFESLCSAEVLTKKAFRWFGIALARWTLRHWGVDYERCMRLGVSKF